MSEANTLNADPRELEKFGELAHRWWDPNSEFKPLHEINPLRLDWIDKAVGLSGKRVADIGCGGGILAESMARRGAQVTGIDLGKGKRMLMRGGKLDTKYNITVPENLDGGL